MTDLYLQEKIQAVWPKSLRCPSSGAWPGGPGLLGLFPGSCHTWVEEVQKQPSSKQGCKHLSRVRMHAKCEALWVVGLLKRPEREHSLVALCCTQVC